MRKADLKAKTPKKKHYHGDTGKVHRIAPNLLKRQFEQSKSNTHWVGDITYIRTHQGWSYLAAVLDLSSKQIVGYALSKKPNAQLAKDALLDAVRKQAPDTGKLLFHSDQGIQYSAKSFIQQLEKLNITQSMSRQDKKDTHNFILLLYLSSLLFLKNVKRGGDGYFNLFTCSFLLWSIKIES